MATRKSIPRPIKTGDRELDRGWSSLIEALKDIHNFGIFINDSGDIVINKDIHCRSIYTEDNSIYIGGVKIQKPKDNEDGYYLQYDKVSKKFTYQSTTSPTTETVQDIAGAMFSGNTETFITATYQDADGTIDLVVPVKDEDNMASDSDTFLATQQSIKAYTDAKTVDTPICLSMYDPAPSRGSESNLHGGLLMLATGQPLNSVPTDIVVSKGIGKLMVVINAGSDVSGEITVTGESINRETGASTPADTDTLTVDALTTDNSDTDTNGNTRHAFTGAYVTSKWFTGSVTLSTTNLTLTDVDVYHVSFEQCNDSPNITIETFDANIYTTNVAAEFDAYLYSLEVTGDKCDITREASLNVGADGETAIANRYWRLRRGNINKALDGTTDGLWADVHYSNSPAYVEDVNIKVWLSKQVQLN